MFGYFFPAVVFRKQKATIYVALSYFAFFHVTAIKSVLAATGEYSQRNIEIQERNGCLPDNTAYDTVMGSKRLTKSSLAQIRNPDLVINLKKEKKIRILIYKL